jgi:hypothetical protein
MQLSDSFIASLFKDHSFRKSMIRSRVKDMTLEDIIAAGSEISSAPKKKNLIAFLLNVFAMISYATNTFGWHSDNFLVFTKLARLISESGYHKVWRLYREACYNVLDVITGFTSRPLRTYPQAQQLNFITIVSYMIPEPVAYLKANNVEELWPNVEEVLEPLKPFAVFVPSDLMSTNDYLMEGDIIGEPDEFGFIDSLED